jgi:hypothetical protein
MKKLNVRHLVCASLITSLLGGCGDSGNINIIDGSDPNPPVVETSWEKEVQYFSNQYTNTHPNPYHQVTEVEYQTMIAELISDYEGKNSIEKWIGYSKMLAELGAKDDGHMQMSIFKNTNFNLYPLRLYNFEEGIYVVDAIETHHDLIGMKLEKIGTMLASEIQEKIFELLTADNSYTLSAKAPFYMQISEILMEIGAVADPLMGDFEFTDYEQNRVSRSLIAINPDDYVDSAQLSLTFNLPNEDQLLYLSELNANRFWQTNFQDGKISYIKYNEVREFDYDGESLQNFVDRVGSQSSSNLERIIVDVRQNNGGDNQTFGPLLDYLNGIDETQVSIVVLTDANTFSAAANFVAEIDRITEAKIIGQTPGGNRSQFGDVIEVNLVDDTGFSVLIPSVYWSFGDESNNKEISVDNFLPNSSSNFFSKSDEVLQSALNLQ